MDNSIESQASQSFSSNCPLSFLVTLVDPKKERSRHMGTRAPVMGTKTERVPRGKEPNTDIYSSLIHPAARTFNV